MRSVTIWFSSVTPKFDYSATKILTAEAQSSQRRGITLLSALEIEINSILLLINSRLRSFVLCALCDSAVLFRNHQDLIIKLRLLTTEAQSTKKGREP